MTRQHMGLLVVLLLVLLIAEAGHWYSRNHINGGQAGKAVSDRVLVFDGNNYEVYSIRDGKVYYRDNVIPEADAATFRIITGEVQMCGDVWCGTYTYTSDKRNVYIDGQVIPGADPATIRIPHRQVAVSIDNEHTFLGVKEAGAAISDLQITWPADTGSELVHIGSSRLFLGKVDYSKTVLFNVESGTMTHLATIDTRSLVAMPYIENASIYVKDKSHVYCAARLLEGLSIVSGADPATFTVVPYGQNETTDGKDKFRTYKNCNVVN